MYTDSLSGPALYLFFWSKSWEFGDTLLLIMRGRKVLFLHAYHHFLVLIQASISYVNAGRFLIDDFSFRFILKKLKIK